MRITIKLFASLRTGRLPEETREVSRGATVRQVMKELEIPENEITLIFLNGRHSEADAELDEGDTLAFFPPVGGG
jgi:molybdopterin converting factor small subunit